MGKSTKHLQEHVPGVSHRIQSMTGGKGAPLAEAEAAKDVPHLPNGEARARGARSEGKCANIAPSQCGTDGLNK